MPCPVAKAWLEVEQSGGARKRVDLPAGLTVLGPAQGPLPIHADGSGALHVWDEPPRLEQVGDGPPPLINGEPAVEHALRAGDRIEWRGCVLVFRSAAQLEEVVAPVDGTTISAGPADPGASGGKGVKGDGRLWRRVKSGLLVELGLVDASVSRPWQEGIRSGSFDADECARAVLGATVLKAGDDPGSLLERTARLQRDLLMAPLQRGAQGARRRAKVAAKNGLAYALAQLVVLLLFAGLALAGLLVGRLLLDWSVDGFLDRIGGLFGA